MIHLVLACASNTGFGVPEKDSTTTETTDTSTTPTDTSDTDADQDDDGFSPEEGDCDDNNVHASPARDEDDEDGIDNDCDGRVDESFVGMTVVYGNSTGGSDLLVIDDFGRLDDEIGVDEACAPIWIDHSGDGYVVNSGYAFVSTVDAEGNCVDVGDFSDPEAFPFGVYGIATAPDGTIYATTLDRLFTVALDGTLTEVASWPCDLSDPDAHELAVYSIAVDIETGEVGLFGYFGGFATWNGEVTMHLTEDWSAPAVYTYSGTHKDGGSWFTPGTDTADGSTNIYRFDLDTTAWVATETWENPTWSPFMLAMDSDEGDFYVTANAGWYYTVWEVISGANYATDLYATDGTEPYRGFYGIVANYTTGG